MEDSIYIIGHKNPDTDSICSAIGYSYYKKEIGVKNVYAARLGEINKETEFVLDYFDVDIPELITTVKMQVKDANIDQVVPISPEISIRKAWNIMKDQNAKTLPVINNTGHLVGICTLSDLTGSYMDVSNNNLFSRSKTSLKNVTETISGKVINSQQFDFSNTGRIVVGATSIGEIEKRVSKSDIVIVGDREDVQRAAIDKGAGCLIITGNHIPDQDIIEYAENKGCMLMSVPHDSFTTARLINMSTPVSFVMATGNIISFDIEDFIDDIKDIMLDTRYRAYPVINKNKVVGTISRYHLIKSNRKKVILVDHNEKSQSVDGLDEAEILEIIDHHRVADIQTTTPVFFNNRPIGSTSTIIANLFLEGGFVIPRKIAGILCAAIISDTLLFKSPTSTKIDEITVRKLSDIAGIDIYDFSSMMFKAGTSLSGKSALEIFYQDFKEFYLGKKKIGVSQVYTMDIGGTNDIKEELLSLMEDIKDNKGYDLVMLMLTDIINEGSELLFTMNGREVISKAFDVHVTKNEIYLPGVVSRKKQVIPPLASALYR
jgi:Inorganic pyrophosphatase/exopolyphosphatase